MKPAVRPLIGLLCLLLGACNSAEQNVALGTLERERISLSATATELVSAIHVTEGAHVQPGDLLVSLDDTRQRTRVALAEAEVSLARAELLELENGARTEEIESTRARLAAARARFKDARLDEERARALYAHKMIGQAEHDQARADLETAEANVREQSEQLDLLLNGTRPERLQQARARVNAAKQTLALEQQALDELSIRSTRHARVDDLPWHAGERIGQGMAAAVLLADQAPYVQAYLPEPYRAHTRIGDSLEVRVEGIAQVFHGTVRRISHEPAFTPHYALNQEERARLVYLCEVQLGEDAQDLASGLPAQVLLP